MTQKSKQIPKAAMLKPDEAWVLVGINAISRRAFYLALGRGEIPSRRVGRRILIPRHAFMRWLEGDNNAEFSKPAA